MSDFIERSNGIEPDPDGVFVFYEDYQKLQDEIERLTARVAELEADIKILRRYRASLSEVITERDALRVIADKLMEKP